MKNTILWILGLLGVGGLLYYFIKKPAASNTATTVKPVSTTNSALDGLQSIYSILTGKGGGTVAPAAQVTPSNTQVIAQALPNVIGSLSIGISALFKSNPVKSTPATPSIPTTSSGNWGVSTPDYPILANDFTTWGASDPYAFEGY